LGAFRARISTRALQAEGWKGAERGRETTAEEERAEEEQKEEQELRKNDWMGEAGDDEEQIIPD
jgi:hypothetical protein